VTETPKDNSGNSAPPGHADWLIARQFRRRILSLPAQMGAPRKRAASFFPSKYKNISNRLRA